MSSKDDFTESEESESGEDFSASEDEWKPGKDDSFSEEEEDEDTANSDDDDANGEGASKIKGANKKKQKAKGIRKIAKAPKLSANRRPASNLRSKLYRRYNPPPKTVSKSPVPVKVANLLSNSQYVQRKQMPSTSTAESKTASSDSESSGDEGLVRPDDIDLRTLELPQKVVDHNISEAPNFDCNAGMNLSDSSADDDDDNDDFDTVQPNTSQFNNTNAKKKKSIIGKINDKSANEIHDFSHLQQFNKNLESAKAQLEKLKNKEVHATSKVSDESDITKLLSMGEKTSSATTSKVNRKRRHKDDPQSDESDWENVSDDNAYDGSTGIKDIQITVGSSAVREMSRDKKKALDMEACIKRRLNRNIKEKQVILHKTSVLCWVAHGNYINRILNDTSLMELCIKLLPSKNAYPKGDTDIKYYSMITEWFHGLFTLKSKNLYCELKGIRSKILSLALQIRSKHVISKCDYVLLFVCMLRSIGIQCRLVINLAVPPIRPPQKDLLVISTKSKETENTEEKESNENSKSDSVAKKLKVSAKKMKTSFAEKDVPKRKKATESHKNVNSNKESVKSEKSQGKISQAITPKIVTKACNINLTKMSVSAAVALHSKRRINEGEGMKEVKKTKETGNSVSTVSPRKTRSRAGKVADDSKAINTRAQMKVPQFDGGHDLKKNETRTAKNKSSKKNDSNSDSDFAPSPPKRLRTKAQPVKPGNRTKKLDSKANTSAKIDRRVFSSDEGSDADLNTEHMDFWVESYAEKEKKWIVIDPVKKKVDCADHIRKCASKPIIYALAWNNDNSIRDVTPRYCSQFHTGARKLRAEQLWIDDMLRLFIEQRNVRTIMEDVEFSKLHMDTPMPKSISEFKNHPLYALKRHLLKFEGIYPENALTLGYIRDEPIYARECVHTLHSREIWVKQARTVKVGEKPYKIVKARPKWNRVLNQMEEAKPLEIFGFWQTQPYEPPVAENGLVPRNPYGNVELFKPEMLPIGTRHLQLPNLNRICKKMGVDCAQAVVGFDFHGGSSHPTFDGFVVCEEFADAVIEQWEIEQEEQIQKETGKREARVFGNWKKLIKGLLIRERLKRKFNFGGEYKPEKSQGKKKAQKQ